MFRGWRVGLVGSTLVAWDASQVYYCCTMCMNADVFADAQLCFGALAAWFRMKWVTVCGAMVFDL